MNSVAFNRVCGVVAPFAATAIGVGLTMSMGLKPSIPLVALTSSFTAAVMYGVESFGLDPDYVPADRGDLLNRRFLSAGAHTLTLGAGILTAAASGAHLI